MSRPQTKRSKPARPIHGDGPPDAAAGNPERYAVREHVENSAGERSLTMDHVRKLCERSWSTRGCLWIDPLD